MLQLKNDRTNRLKDQGTAILGESLSKFKNLTDLNLNFK